MCLGNLRVHIRLNNTYVHLIELPLGVNQNYQQIGLR